MNLKTQKFLLLSVVLLILQLSIYYLEIFTHLQLTQTVTDSWFFVVGTLSTIFGIISIAKKESGAGGAVIGFEIFMMLLLMVGHGG